MQKKLNKIKQIVKGNFKVESVEVIDKAYNFAKLVYFGEKRLSGKPWISHSLNTALECANVQGDKYSVAAAILHDAYKFGATEEEVKQEVGDEVALILSNLESIKSIRQKFKGLNIEEKSLYNEYLRRVTIAVSSDVRVIIIRLCEKLVGLKDAKDLPKDKQADVYKNAFDIYAPLSDMLGLWVIRSKIENRAFKGSKPKTYDKFKKLLKRHKASTQKTFDRFVKKLKVDLKTEGINYIDLFGRVKSPYSFYKKTLRYADKKRVSVSQAIPMVEDKVAFTILVESVDDCYKTLALINQKYNYLSDRVDDYIKNPKPNGYKSLQTTIELTPKNFIEIQIKTPQMHEYNEFGPASHVYYKLYGDKQKVSQQKLEVLKNLVKWKNTLGSSDGYNIKNADTNILTFTPKGDVIELPKQSTPVDFAYHIHTKLGHTCVKAIINEKLCTLNTKLNSGDVVKILTDKHRKGPSRDWLNIVKSREAKHAIKKYLRNNR